MSYLVTLLFMISPATNPNFSELWSSIDKDLLLQCLMNLEDEALKSCCSTSKTSIPNDKTNENLKELAVQWQNISKRVDSTEDSEQAATSWLIDLFNTLFAEQQVILARGDGEPEYFPAQDQQPARIEFAHGFFASALHEMSHWCVAGKERRGLSDFGYWYAPDGRTAAQQQAFERVEIKPQALECLFTLVCGRRFQVSQDNLFADFDTSGSTFARDVYLQVEAYITDPHTLPRDAKTLLCILLQVCNDKSTST